MIALIRAALASLFWLGVANAYAQDFQQAVRDNVAGAMMLCLQNHYDPPTLMQKLKDVGFAHTPEDFGDGTVLHWFAAPMGTMSVTVVPTPGAMECRVNTDHMGVTEAVNYAGAVLEHLHPGLFSYGDMEGGAPVVAGSGSSESCTGYIGWSGQRPLVVRVGVAGQDPMCIEDGTSQIMMLF